MERFAKARGIPVSYDVTQAATLITSPDPRPRADLSPQLVHRLQSLEQYTWFQELLNMDERAAATRFASHALMGSPFDGELWSIVLRTLLPQKSGWFAPARPPAGSITRQRGRYFCVMWQIVNSTCDCTDQSGAADMLVRIVKNYPYPDLMRQTPGNSRVWNDIEFTTDPVDNCDYVIVLNHAVTDVTVNCPPGNVWAVMQEPPNETYRFMHRGNASFGRIYTQDLSLTNCRHIQTQPVLPWHVNRDYDFLIAAAPPEKTKSLSWVTGNGNAWKGHRVRMRFLEQIKDKIPFNLYGRGFTPIADKWDGIAPYRYSIAFENFSSPHYWSEKIADCFLAWTMPIYFGCTRISEFFSG